MGFSIARASAWENLYKAIFPAFEDLVGNIMTGHASLQWIMSWALQNKEELSLELLPDNFHNAHWFDNQPNVNFDGEYLRAGSDVVLFAHTKFAINPKY